MRLRFLKTILVLTVALAALLAYPMYAWLTPATVDAIVAAGIIAFVNVIIGCIILEYAIDASNTRFMFSVFGGMGLRMAGILVVLTILLLNDYHALTLALSLMGFYVAFMIAEITYVVRELNRRPSRKSQAKPGKADFPTHRALSLNPRGNDARA